MWNFAAILLLVIHIKIWQCSFTFADDSKNSTFAITKVLLDGSTRIDYVNISYGESVHNALISHCEDMKTTLEECSILEDNISRRLYSLAYTPTCKFCGVKEYTSSRIDIVKLISNRFNYKIYLEIGAHENELFDAVKNSFNKAVGVDPAKGGTLRMTSDAFFLTNKEVLH